MITGPFAVGSSAQAAATKPNASNTGVPAGTTLTNYTGPLTITVDGTVIDKKAVHGDLKIAARNVIIRNSYLHCGTNVPSGNSGQQWMHRCQHRQCIQPAGDLTNNTIEPDRPNFYRDGIVGQKIHRSLQPHHQDN